MKLAHTRTMVNAALSGALDDAETRTDPVFGLEVPTHVAGVPDEVLTPRQTWADADDYDAKAAQLARMFADNFERYADSVPAAVREAGPAIEAPAG